MNQNQDNQHLEQEENKSRTISYYKVNQLVNLRLTAKRKDIMNVLNEKKEQGVDISDYLANLIRHAEGLPTPNEEGEPIRNPFPAPTPTEFKLSDSQMDTLLEKIMKRMSEKGVQVVSSNGEIDEDAKIEQDQAMKDELKSIADGLLDWD